MKRRFFIIGLALAALLPACIPSLHPLYTEDTLAFETRLLGQWTDKDGGNWQFDRTEGKGYLLTLKEAGSESGEGTEYEVHLVRLNGYYFLDVKQKGGMGGDLAPLLPCHSFYKVVWENDRAFSLFVFDIHYLDELFQKRRIRIKHEQLEDGTTVLTAAPEELQKFVVKYAEDPKAFVEPLALKK